MYSSDYQNYVRERKCVLELKILNEVLIWVEMCTLSHRSIILMSRLFQLTWSVIFWETWFSQKKLTAMKMSCESAVAIAPIRFFMYIHVYRCIHTCT